VVKAPNSNYKDMKPRGRNKSKYMKSSEELTSSKERVDRSKTASMSPKQKDEPLVNSFVNVKMTKTFYKD